MTIRVTHQNGCSHALSRAELESIVGQLPSKLNALVTQIVLYSAEKQDSYTKYFPKKKILGLYCGPTQSSKERVVEELLVGIDFVLASGEIPKTVSKNRYQQIVKNSDALKEKCMEAVDAVN